MKAEIKKGGIGVTFDDIDTAILHIKIDKSALNGFTLDDSKKYVVDIHERRKHRSLSANSYMWVLLDKMARLLRNGETKESLYLRFIRESGVFDARTFIKKSHYAAYKRFWEQKGLGFQCNVLQTVGDFVNVICYFGSSTYTTKEMSDLLERIVSACEELGIQTMTPKERQKMYERERKMKGEAQHTAE